MYPTCRPTSVFVFGYLLIDSSSFVLCSQAWSGSPARNFSSLRYRSIWLYNTTTAPPLDITHMSSTSDQLSAECMLIRLTGPAALNQTTPTRTTTVIITTTTTTSTESSRDNTSADAASNVCKDISFELFLDRKFIACYILVKYASV